jgi:aminopeptidase-like protein
MDERLVVEDHDTQPVEVAAGLSMYRLMAELYPICRSITGEGVRQTLRILQKHVPVVLHEVPSGTPAFDWTVPNEWNIREAYIADSSGRRIVDFAAHSLHVLNYSVPFRGKLSLADLKPHLFTLPDRPDLIPYRTSYYAPNWGFCLPHHQMEQMAEGEYEVVIDSTLAPGALTYGELLLPGTTTDEVLITTHICHPSMCNDNLSGIVVATWLAKLLSAMETRYSYRFLFIPATIGSLTWLSQNRDVIPRIKHGLVLQNLGDGGAFTCKKTRAGDHEIDRAVAQALRDADMPHQIVEFLPYGYDERQFNSPGLQMPVGAFSRSQYDTYPQYHTSADNLDFVRPNYLEESLEVLRSVISILERNRRYVNTSPFGEPQLGRRGLYHAIAGDNNKARAQLAMLWVLNLADGQHDLLAMAERSGLPFEAIANIARVLVEHDLLVAQEASADHGGDETIAERPRAL